MTIKVLSQVFEDGNMIPSKYTCDGMDVSPPLQFEAIPEEAQSVALIMDDPDAPMGTWVHWILFNLPPETAELKEDMPRDGQLPSGAIQGMTDFGKTGYGGMPLPGESRSYSESYDQMGGQVAVRFEHRQGFLAQLDVGQVSGTLKSTSGFTTDREGYELTMLGMGLGFDARYFGADLGVSTNISGDKTGAYPRFNLRLGQLEYLWFEIGTNPMGGRTVGLGLNIGMGFITRYIDGHLGYNPTGNLQPLVTLVPGREGNVEFGGPPGGIGFFYGSLGVRITGSFGLHLGGTVGNTNSLHLGFNLYL